MSAPQLTQYVQGQGVVTADGLNTFLQTTNLAKDLRNFIGVPGINVLALGVVFIGDNKGGVFYWNSTGTGPDDGVNTIVPFGASTGVWTRVTTVAAPPPLGTRQLLLSSGTYITPTGARQLRLRMVGGGGGGTGSGVGAGNGGNGSSSVFNGYVAVAGFGALFSGQGGAGGSSGANGSGASFVSRLPGQYGNAGNSGLPAAISLGGGSTPLGFGGQGSYAGPGIPGFGYGSGGQGGTANANYGVGGGASEYVELLFNNPAASYAYTIGGGGAGGTAGTAGTNGGAGAPGAIFVDEYY